MGPGLDSVLELGQVAGLQPAIPSRGQTPGAGAGTQETPASVRDAAAGKDTRQRVTFEDVFGSFLMEQLPTRKRACDVVEHRHRQAGADRSNRLQRSAACFRSDRNVCIYILIVRTSVPSLRGGFERG